MRKSDKKLEKRVVSALTEACEDALKIYEGFQWLTHIINFQSFPESLTIICVFDTSDNLMKTTGNNKIDQFKTSIEARLFAHNIKVKDIKKRIVFDTEEACNNEHGGNWRIRLDDVQYAHHA